MQRELSRKQQQLQLMRQVATAGSGGSISSMAAVLARDSSFSIPAVLAATTSVSSSSGGSAVRSSITAAAPAWLQRKATLEWRGKGTSRLPAK